LYLEILTLSRMTSVECSRINSEITCFKICFETQMPAILGKNVVLQDEQRNLPDFSFQVLVSPQRRQTFFIHPE